MLIYIPGLVIFILPKPLQSISPELNACDIAIGLLIPTGPIGILFS